MELEILTQKIINGHEITSDEAEQLLEVPLNQLTKQANILRKHFCGNKFDACTIINIKSGKCGENCIFCSQSIHHQTNIKEYPLMSNNELEKQSLMIYEKGVNRVSFVASGKNIEDDEFKQLIKSIKKLNDNYENLKICVSLGLLTENQIKTLKKYNVDRIHNNLETSENFFNNICTTHSFNDKIETLKVLKNKDINICSGGIFGLGESFGNRIELAFKLKSFGIKSIPINILHPIAGTPVENCDILTNEEVCKIIAIFRFINPDSFIRLAGGRSLLEDNGKKAFQSGCNAAILGNMLTTDGVLIDNDIEMIKKLGYEITYDI